MSHYKGLSTSEVTDLQKKWGPNVLKAASTNPWWKMLGAQFTDLLVIILIVSAMIAVGAGLYEGNSVDLLDGVVILGIVILNAGIGFFQEFRTERALEALKKLLSPQAVVIRDGEKQLIKAEDIVPGDIVVLNAGDKVPADGKVLSSSELNADEASLTGESVPAYKPVDSELFMGTTVVAGTGIMEVTKIGMETQFGRIAQLTTQTVQDKSPLQKEMLDIGLFVTKVTLFLCAILMLVAILVQEKQFLEALLFAVSVAVAAVPEGLPATITVALALGVQRMARRNVIVKKLSSIETLGATTVICSDKTGTLTRNEMTVTRILLGADELLEVTGSGYDPKQGEIQNPKSKIQNMKSEIQNPKSKIQNESLEKIRLIASYCTEAELQMKDGRYQIIGDPTEGALLTMAQKNVVGHQQLPEISELDVIDKIPFDSVRKMMSVLVRGNEKRKTKNEKEMKNEKMDGVELWSKGSPDALIENSTHILEHGEVVAFTEEMKRMVKMRNEEMASQALRVLGFAYKPLPGAVAVVKADVLERDLIFVGLAGMIDPPREEVPEAVALCHKAGIRTIVITGDHGLTAKAIAQQIGIANEETPVVLGTELDGMSEEQLDELLKAQNPKSPNPKQIPNSNVPMSNRSIIFSRVSPENKRRIVDRLKVMGEIVAVTGDGVNDAPALKRADMGIAMGITGTEVSKETANMILLDDSFASIVKAVEEGRTIYANLRKFTWFVFSCNFSELLVVFAAIMMNVPMPLTAILILAVNVGTDILPAIALGVDYAEPNGMTKKPRDPAARIMNRGFVTHCLLLGLYMGAVVLGLFLWKLSSLGWSYGEQLSTLDPQLLTASTFAFVTLVMLQLFNAFNARSFDVSILKLNTLWHLWGACIASVGLVFLMTIPEAAQKIFHTTALSLQDWLIILVAGASVILVEEIRKKLVT